MSTCPKCGTELPDSGGAVVQRITAYLAGGGLFNPELANHDAVRDLLIDARDALTISVPERNCSVCRGSGTVYDTTRGPDGGPETCPSCLGEGDRS